jgi:hypothetical protein
MTYRYSSIDIIVGVGMCAIVFGALLFVVATSGIFLAAAPVEPSSSMASGMAWLQPALGQAIVERFVLQRQTDQMTKVATTERNQALLAHRSLQTLSGGPFGFVIERAATVPIEHDARVQGVMGRSIVNFTRRGVRSGALSADQYLSDFNRDMIGATETMGARLHRDFMSIWQPLLGRWIVEAGREYQNRVAQVQEQLGAAILHVAQAHSALDEAWAANQYQLGSLMAAMDRGGVMPDRLVALAADGAEQRRAPAVSAGTISWPDVPMGYLVVAMFFLCLVFFGGATLSAASREAKALAEAKRNSTRWVYRMAA